MDTTPTKEASVAQMIIIMSDFIEATERVAEIFANHDEIIQNISYLESLPPECFPKISWKGISTRDMILYTAFGSQKNNKEVNKVIEEYKEYKEDEKYQNILKKYSYEDLNDLRTDIIFKLPFSLDGIKEPINLELFSTLIEEFMLQESEDKDFLNSIDYDNLGVCSSITLEKANSLLAKQLRECQANNPFDTESIAEIKGKLARIYGAMRTNQILNGSKVIFR